MATDARSEPASRRSPGRPKLEDVASIDRKLIEVALQEFVNFGYGAASLTRIVKVAEVSKTTLYSRFPSKADLFRAIIQHHIDTIGANSALRTPTGRPGLEDGLKAYGNRMLERSLQGDFLAINRLIYGESHRFPEVGAAADERTAFGVDQIAEFIEESLKSEGQTCTNARAAAETFIMMLRGWYVNAMLTGREIPDSVRRQWVDYAVDIILRGRAAW